MNKKFLTMAAAAMMFAACSNEMDTISSPEVAQDNTEVSAQTPVLFDAYTGRALTRAGDAGALENPKLKEYGFGVFGYYTENEFYNDTYQPTFMYNAKVSGDNWTYSPLKYWPNEFGGAASSDDIDRLSFFAYAPYVHVNPSTGIPDGANDDKATGIIAMTRNSSTGDPFVKYAVNFTDLTKQVDFSWGVAKTGAPTAVTGAQQATVEAGSPFKDLVKPAADQKIGFEFNHALAQLNVQVDAKVDGADNVDINNTRIWVRSVTFEGFATKGMFNLNQSKVGAVWSDLSGNSISSSSVTIYDGRTDGKEGVSAATNEIPALCDKIVQAGAYSTPLTGPRGVTVDPSNLFNATSLEAPLYVIPNQQAFKVTIVYDVETVDPKLPTYLADGVTKGSRVQNTISQTVTFGSATQLEAGKKYTLKLHLGMSTVKFDAQVTDWVAADPAEVEVMLPINVGTSVAPGTTPSQNTLNALKSDIQNLTDEQLQLFKLKGVDRDGNIEGTTDSRYNESSKIGVIALIDKGGVADDSSRRYILVMDIADAASNKIWSSVVTSTGHNENTGKDGIAATAAIPEGDREGVKTVIDNLNSSRPAPSGSSGWFIPSIDQWGDMQAFGGYDMGRNLDGWYWSSSEFSGNGTSVHCINSRDALRQAAPKASETHNVRAVFAY